MCVSIDSKNTCVFSGLPMSRQTPYGLFCNELCGYKETEIFAALNGELPKKVERKSLDVLPTKPLIAGSKEPSKSNAADRYIAAVHAWIEAVKSKFFSE